MITIDLEHNEWVDTIEQPAKVTRGNLRTIQKNIDFAQESKTKEIANAAKAAADSVAKLAELDATIALNQTRYDEAVAGGLTL